MVVTFTVVWAKNGLKRGFRKLSRARAFAKIKANKLRRDVFINRTKTEMSRGEIIGFETKFNVAIVKPRKR